LSNLLEATPSPPTARNEAATLLDDKVLDASVEHNQVAFTIADQREE
jgi:hypothetical protein